MHNLVPPAGGDTGVVAPLVLDPSTVLREGPLWRAALNRNQDLLGKIVLVLRREADDVLDVTAEEWASFPDEVRRVRTAVDALFRPDAWNHAFLMNLDRQVHCHVVPRYAGERRWNGEVFRDPHFGEVFGPEQRLLSATQLEDLREEVRAQLP
jgi:diadenosine tetraphosphate (Ap4A) HIT family hydrolase